MAIYAGTRPFNPGQACIEFEHRPETVVTFDTPADFLYYLNRRPDIKDEIQAGEWKWVEGAERSSPA